MTAQANKYSHAAHIKNVTQAARAAGLKGSAFAVLAYMCAAADFDKPTVRVSKETICKRTGYHWDTVRIALRALRDAKFLDPVAYVTGGRHRGTVYVLRAGKGAENPPTLDTQETAKGGGFSGQKGVENPVKRGRKIHPHPNVSPNVSSEREGGASRAGIERTPLDEKAKQELALFSRECSAHGYTEARERAERRKAARLASGDLP